MSQLSAKRQEGIRYERKFGRHLRNHALGEVHSGRWFRARHNGKLVHRQPDFYVLRPSEILLFECKLKQTESAEWQLREYERLLRAYHQLPVLRCQVCKYLRRTPDYLVESPADVLAYPRPETVTLHWLGS